MNRMNNEHLSHDICRRQAPPSTPTLPTPFTTITHSPTLFNDNNEIRSLEYGWMDAEGMDGWACMYVSVLQVRFEEWSH